MAVYYFDEDVKTTKIKKRKLNAWIKSCVSDYDKRVGDINYIFCSDEYLKEINIKYLDHHYFTDVITFNNNIDDIVSGDIYISIDRVAENADDYNVKFINELHRVMIHGVLHLLGFNDKTEDEQKEMRAMENLYLGKLDEIE